MMSCHANTETPDRGFYPVLGVIEINSTSLKAT